MNIHGEYHESSAEPVTRSAPLSHVSIELGHLYPEDLDAGDEVLQDLFARTTPWAEAVRRSLRVEGRRKRVSTCFLVDDYFGDLPGPRELLPRILQAAQEAGVAIDYLAREAACARCPGETGEISPARTAVALLVDEPVPGTLGVRPSARECGWLCNGARGTSAEPVAAMELPGVWSPPAQSCARRHSIFVDVQLWSEDGQDRIWSCPLLAATWQLLRLGLLRHGGGLPLRPEPPPALWPEEWSRTPGILQINPQADPFCAYTTFSVLAPRFLPVETAVRTILEQVCHDPEALRQIDQRSRGEGFAVPVEVPDRVRYVFAGRSESEPP